ncbi:MAG: hypothetical protein KDB21_11030 [Acidimicrobiales bacterium]|nr:hypothetical protein [Acidimicrobiales bacterium]
MADHDQAAEIEALREELRQVRAELRTLVSRRALFGLAGAGVVGAVVAAAPGTAAAADGDNLVLGQQNDATTRTVLLAPDTDGALFVQNTGNAVAIYGISADNTGVWGQTTDSTAVIGLDSGLTNAGVGVGGFSTNGRGVVGSGGLAALRLIPAAAEGPPTAGAHLVGDLVLDSTSVLYLCTAAGDPGTWRRVDSPDPPPSFSPVAPARVYDSRWPGQAGPILTGLNRTLSVADGKAIGDGTVTVADLVPSGATAVAYNITVVNTEGRGFLTVLPGGTTTVTVASVNWAADGAVVANASLVALGGDREVTVVCGGLGGTATDFVIDVVGYYG